jgi:hypothetical protein
MLNKALPGHSPALQETASDFLIPPAVRGDLDENTVNADSPLAADPKTRTLRAPWRAAIFRIRWRARRDSNPQPHI